FKSVDVDSWRAYGIANFGLARYIYGLNVGPETGELLHLIIPDREYRIGKDKILLRALIKEDIKIMEKNIYNVFLHDGREENVTFYNGKEVLLFDEQYYKDIVGLAVKEIGNKKYQKVILSRKIPPETIAEVDASGTVYTFPLAGTRALTGDSEKNKKLKEELLHDPKEIAEHRQYYMVLTLKEQY
ncbi:MAG: Chorismate binding-like protein, partial [Clostridiaceae bacterium]|nr:Chorismate binding-like protein [Clostridiaceae bacterium]